MSPLGTSSSPNFLKLGCHLLQAAHILFSLSPHTFYYFIALSNFLSIRAKTIQSPGIALVPFVRESFALLVPELRPKDL